MTISLTGTGGLFTRVGRMGGLLNAINSFRGSANLAAASIVSIGVGCDNIEAQFQSTRQDLVDLLYTNRDSHRSAYSGMAGYLNQLAIDTVVEMANDDAKLAPSKSLFLAVKELIRQMAASTDSVKKPTVSATVAAGSANSGNAVCIASVLGKNGVQLDYPFAEVIDVLCTSDSQVGSTLGREPLSYNGDGAQTDSLALDWPLGSGTSGSLNAVDASEDAGTNKLTNSDFEAFTSNTPDNWVIAVGSAGGTVQESSSANAFGATGKALQIIGDGAELTSVTQEFDDSTDGTAATLKPLTVYAVNCWLKVSAVPSGGVLKLELVDSTPTVINDAAGTANAITKDLTTATTSYVALNGFFRTPAVLPSTIKFRVRLSTALESGKSVFVDHLAMAEAVQLYAGGPFARVFSGSSKLIVDDSYTITVANDAYTGTGSAWQKLAERFWGMRALGLQLPSAGSPTIAENLIA